MAQNLNDILKCYDFYFVFFVHSFCVPIVIGIVGYGCFIKLTQSFIIHLFLLIFFAGRETGVASGVKDSTTTLSATTGGLTIGF